MDRQGTHVLNDLVASRSQLESAELTSNDGVTFMVQAAQGLHLDVERGPGCLFVRPHRDVIGESALEFANEVWHLLEQSMTHRLVLELDDIGPLYSNLIGQLVLLQKRISVEGGLMRICGLSQANQRVLDIARLGNFFGQYNDRNDAVMCNRPR